MKYFSLFSGIGGFELGLQQAYELQKMGVESKDSTNSESKSPQYRERPLCVGYSEIDKYAIQIYQSHFPTHTNYGNIKEINWNTVPDFDLLVGGSPCQDVSIAGKRAGLIGERSGLFTEYVRALKEKKPRHFIWENVKGALSSSQGWDFVAVISSFTEAGYDVQWQILNSKDFGVAQNRERIFVIGTRGESRPEVFPITGSNEINTQSDGQGNAYCLQTGDKHRGTYIRQLNNPTHSNNRIYGEDGISPTLNTAQGGNRQPKIVIPVLTPDRAEKRQNGRRFKTDGEPSFTLTGQDKHGVYDGMSIRRLTPVECARLQGFPDNWHEGVSDSQAYKAYGNAVTVNVVRAIIERLVVKAPQV